MSATSDLVAALRRADQAEAKLARIEAQLGRWDAYEYMAQINTDLREILDSTS